MDIKKEIEDDLNQLMNKFIIKHNEYLNWEIQAKIGNYLADFYMPTFKIRDYIVTSNYPDVKILIKNINHEIVEIRIKRFERLEKLQKLKEISK